MKIDKRYLAKVLNTQRFYSKLREGSLFTYNSHREASFHVEKEPEKNHFGIRGIEKGEYNRAVSEFENSATVPVSDSLFNYVPSYRIISVHTHHGEHGAIVPSFGFDVFDDPGGDLAVLRSWRASKQAGLGYDAKLIMGIAKARDPTKFDLLLLQEKTDKPLEISELLEIERTMHGYYESGRVRTLEGNYQASQEVVEALKETGFYNAALIRYRRGRALKEDLGMLVEFEFDEIKLQTPPSML